MKYFLGFVRTQLSTSVTIVLVFGPKVSNSMKVLFFMLSFCEIDYNFNFSNFLFLTCELMDHLPPFQGFFTKLIVSIFFNCISFPFSNRLHCIFSVFFFCLAVSEAISWYCKWVGWANSSQRPCSLYDWGPFGTGGLTEGCLCRKWRTQGQAYCKLSILNMYTECTDLGSLNWKFTMWKY